MTSSKFRQRVASAALAVQERTAIASVEAERDELGQLVTQLRDDLATRDETITQLRHELADAERRVEDRSEIAELKAEVARLEGRLAEIPEPAVIANRELTASNERIRALEYQVREAERASTKMVDQIVRVINTRAALNHVAFQRMCARYQTDRPPFDTAAEVALAELYEIADALQVIDRVSIPVLRK